MATRTSTKGRRTSAGPSTQSFVKVSQRNYLRDLLREQGLWLLLNGRYAFIYAIGLGGRLADLPERNERPLLAAILAIYGGFLGISLLFFILNPFALTLSGLFDWRVPLYAGLAVAYVAGAYYLVMEYRGGESIVGTALAIDLVLNTTNVLLQTINMVMFGFFLLTCVKSWREIVRLPERSSRPRS
jgi:hypothetical protein